MRVERAPQTYPSPVPFRFAIRHRDPVQIGALDTEGSAVDVAIAGSLALVGDDLGGLRLVEVSDPSAPAEFGAHEVLGWVSRVAAAGPYVHAGTSNEGLRVVDIANPPAPAEVGNIPISVEDLTVVGTLLHVAEPTAPVEVGSYDGPGASYAVALAGPHAYLAGSLGLRVVDVTNPPAPVEIGSHDAREVEDTGTSDIAVSGGHLVLADETAGLDVMTGCRLFVDGFEIGTTATWGLATP